MRLSSLFAIAGVFLAAAALCVITARIAVTTIEDSSRTAVLTRMDASGLPWAEVDTDGLQVFLAGTAPSEAARFKALTEAGAVVEASRVIDQMLVEELEDIAPPRFSIQILRNDTGISLIGLVPDAMDRAGFVESLRASDGDAPVADFLESARHAPPEGWDAVTEYALRAMDEVGRAKISVDANRIEVRAMTESPEEKADVEAALLRRVPEGVELVLDISAPRPVITPFTLRFVIDEEGARFDACSADTEEARVRIIEAARAAGVEGDIACTLGLGVPTPRWAEAAELAIEAVAQLGGGAVTFSDADISLLAPQGTEQDKFDDTVGRLESALPEVFALTAVLPPAESDEEPGGPEFVATLSPEGLVQLRGRIPSAADRKLVDSFAKARFSSSGVDMSARVDDAMPGGWTFRVLTGLEALSYLSNGIVRITPETLALRGSTGEAEASNTIAGMLSEKLGEGAQFTIDVTYKEALDPVAAIPTPEECEADIAAIQRERKIIFDPGSANIGIEARAIMDDIAEILRECGEISMEIGGHTDSQGRETMNQQLSQARAQTILNELRMRRVLTASITAVGYGETRPIADNDTEEGREANRRIEFKVILPDEASEETSEDATPAETGEETSDADQPQEQTGEDATAGEPEDAPEATPEEETSPDEQN